MARSDHRVLAEAKVDLVLTARREPRLRELADELMTAHGVEVDVLADDLSQPEAPASVIRGLAARSLSIDLHAGFPLQVENQQAIRVMETVPWPV